MIAVAAHGLRIELPPRWEARLYRRDQPEASTSQRQLFATAAHPDAYGHEGLSNNAVLHLANFALLPGRGDFGTGAVETMRSNHVFAALLEYDRDEAGQALFAHRGLPRPTVEDFAPNALQRNIVGQLGCQRFFNESGRAFCLYVVLGSRRHAASLVAQLHRALDGLEVEPA